MASFTAAGNSVTYSTGQGLGNGVSVAISGTYDQSILLQRRGPTTKGRWRTLAAYSTADATVAQSVLDDTEAGVGMEYRLIVDAVGQTPGTATATLTGLNVDNNTDGNAITLEANAAVVPGMSGKLITFGAAAGMTLTLPPATGSGARFRFRVGTAATSNANVISTTDVFSGVILTQDGDAETTQRNWQAGATDNTITLNGTATGGVVDDYIEIEDVSAGEYLVFGHVHQSGGSEATPFSTV